MTDRKITFRINSALKDALHHKAITEHTSMNALIVKAIELLMETDSKPADDEAGTPNSLQGT
ncbi:toxin-antitoxin system HicB family antitoxin [Ancrocorticia populi]|uniref:toxin-antitoxin system HicB family antitoxin n=1 Tax=Ancrocorticia populi TaxID=2175228 RepID=UPI003F9430F8